MFFLIVNVYFLSRMSLEKKLRARIEGKQTKRKTLKLIKWLQKKHLLRKTLRCTLCHHNNCICDEERSIHLVCDIA